MHDFIGYVGVTWHLRIPLFPAKRLWMLKTAKSETVHLPHKCWSLYSYIWARVSSLRKQPTFGDVSTGFPGKWRLRNERRNSILMTPHYPDLGSASDWSYRVGNLIQPIRITTQMWVVTRYQYGIFSYLSLVFKIEKKIETSPINVCRNLISLSAFTVKRNCSEDGKGKWISICQWVS